MAEKPVIAIMIGDPCGIGPEVVVKALASGEIDPLCRPVLVGSAWAVEQAVKLVGAGATVRRTATVAGAGEDPATIDVLDAGHLAPADITVGHVSAACGRAVLEWQQETDRLVQTGQAQAAVMAPVNQEAITLAGGRGAADAQPMYLFLITGPLRIVHLTDHIPLSQVPAAITKENLLDVLKLVQTSLTQWGIPHPRIGVPSLNPHAVGTEEQEEIVPALQEAHRLGINAVGPVPADTIFRQCVEGDYDVVLALYHDQGHIAAKVYRFHGIAAIQLGRPFLRLSVAHGTAFDIAGKGIADPTSIREAIKIAASLAAGKGFPQ